MSEVPGEIQAMNLDPTFLGECRQRIAKAIVPAMARLYDRDEPTWPDPQEKLLRAGSVYRLLVTGHGEMVPIADERTNASDAHHQVDVFLLEPGTNRLQFRNAVERDLSNCNLCI